MSPPTRSRRAILRRGGTVAAALGTSALAGCISNSTDSTDPTGGGTATDGADAAGTGPLADVPPTGEAVFTVDVDAFLRDDAVRTAYNAWLRARAEIPDYDGPTKLAGQLDTLAERQGFDLRDLSRIAGFLSFDGEEPARSSAGTGYIFEGAWDASTALATVNHEYVDYRKSTYGSRTIYQPSESDDAATMGVLGDGKYVLGGPEAVRGAIDVARGETAPMDGAVADAYRGSRAGPVRFATTVRETWIPDAIGGEEERTDLSPVQAIETAAGAVYRDGNARGVRLSLNTPDVATAKQLDDTLRAVLALVRSRANSGRSPAFVRDLIGDISVGRNGATVTASIERTVAELEGIATKMGERSASGMGGGVDSPTAAFDWEYDPEARTVTITHTAGDHISAANLLVRGEGFADVSGADMTSAGKWTGSTTDEGLVTAGSQVVVGVRSDYELRLIWTAENVSAVLDQSQGPDA